MVEGTVEQETKKSQLHQERFIIKVKILLNNSRYLEINHCKDVKKVAQMAANSNLYVTYEIYFE